VVTPAGDPLQDLDDQIIEARRRWIIGRAHQSMPNIGIFFPPLSADQERSTTSPQARRNSLKTGEKAVCVMWSSTGS
jgi:hypothetical protein